MAFEYWAIVNRVIDGDTICCDVFLTPKVDPDNRSPLVDMGFRIWAPRSHALITIKDEKIRLFGINAPEMKGETLLSAKRSRDYLAWMLEGKKILLKTVRGSCGVDAQEKYGRYLGIIFLEGQNINNLLVRDGYAKPIYTPE